MTASAESVQADATAPWLSQWRCDSDTALAAALDGLSTTEPTLLAAMRHAVLLGGKRMRPLLVHASGHACGASTDTTRAPACAVELIHAYSLVHDDLPAMDDDALRRGQPTVHIAHGEAIAILAGDALQTLAFDVLANASHTAQVRIDMLQELARASGAAGMCGGQSLDIIATGRSDATSLDALERLHAMKTGALLRAAIRLGAIAAQADAAQRARLDAFADALGLAFQIRDDLLDIEGDSATLGKTAGKDAAQDKATFPALIGIEGSRTRLAELSARMHDALAGDVFANAHGLRALARQVIERNH